MQYLFNLAQTIPATRPAAPANAQILMIILQVVLFLLIAVLMLVALGIWRHRRDKGTEYAHRSTADRTGVDPWQEAGRRMNCDPLPTGPSDTDHEPDHDN